MENKHKETMPIEVDFLKKLLWCANEYLSDGIIQGFEIEAEFKNMTASLVDSIGELQP